MTIETERLLLRPFQEGDAENVVISRGWGENGQSMLKINYRTGEIAAVMTNQNLGVDQTESGLDKITEML